MIKKIIPIINVLMNNASLLRKFQFTLEKYFDARLPTAQINPTGISKINTGFQFLTIAAALCFPIMGYKDHELFLALW
jgi:short-subunit dehydrogenase involved in D-alanine esterification of teichoic acids